MSEATGLQPVTGAITAVSAMEVITFAVQRPKHLAINEILLRPATQI